MEMKWATIARLIEERKLEEAKALLARHIRQAEILDPRRDDSWAIESDRIAYATLECEGRRIRAENGTLTVSHGRRP